MTEPTIAEVDALRDAAVCSNLNGTSMRTLYALCDFWLSVQRGMQQDAEQHVVAHQSMPAISTTTVGASDLVLGAAVPSVVPTLSAEDVRLIDRIDRALLHASKGRWCSIPVTAYDADVVLRDCRARIEALSAEVARLNWKVSEISGLCSQWRTKWRDDNERNEESIRDLCNRLDIAEAHAEAAGRALREWRDDAGFDNLAADDKLCDFIDTLAAAPAEEGK